MGMQTCGPKSNPLKRKKGLFSFHYFYTNGKVLKVSGFSHFLKREKGPEDRDRQMRKVLPLPKLPKWGCLSTTANSPAKTEHAVLDKS